ncbi:MAG: methylenetetrahydrofolate--tRNA-(uracil(54)-C(5))-methyltransferase (FADH(2)-oxidizing) TrmFO [Candidatus Eisenbacteria bacterium]
MNRENEVVIIGGGLAGTEAALQAARRDVSVVLYEMRPGRMTEAHTSSRLAELVCSNSLKSESAGTASGLIKAELLRFGSALLPAALEVRVPAGTALAVDRMKFAEKVERLVLDEAQIALLRDHVCDVEPAVPTIIASGPLTSPELSAWIESFLGSGNLFFFDAISPIIDGSTIDSDRTFLASRYDKGHGPYVNCPLSEEEFNRFVDELLAADASECRSFEKRLFFEGCLPIEEIARRGRRSLSFGAMKPVGLVDPRTGRSPYAVVQLRPENRERTMYGMVGFQTRLKMGEQKRVFRMIPGLERASFVRYGSVHRNSFINSPACLLPTLQTKKNPSLLFAGQISGVEGYVESIATGLLAGVNAARLAQRREPLIPPADTALGSLCRYICTPRADEFQPMSFNFGLLPVSGAPARGRLQRNAALVARALARADAWAESLA